MANTMSTNREVGNIINKLTEMANRIQDLKESADQIITIASTMGETAKNFVESQLRDYFIPTLDELGWGTGDGNKGSIIKIAEFLGNCTYAQVANNDFISTINSARQDVANYRSNVAYPGMDGMVAPNVVPDGAHSDVFVPGSDANAIGNIPQGASYNSMVGNQPSMETPDARMVQSENKDKTEALKEYTLYQVVRSSSLGSCLSEESSKIEDKVVSEFKTEKEATERANKLNASVSEAERELLKTEYKVVPLEK